MVVKRCCQKCDGTGFRMKEEGIVCAECKGIGYQEYLESTMQKAFSISENFQVSVLMRCVASHVTREQFEAIVDEYCRIQK